MEPKTDVASVSEWLKLREISVPDVRSEREEGSVVTVLKVGFLAVSPTDCAASRVSAPVLASGKCILPTAVIDSNGEPLLHRLPIGLANWVIDCVALARTGERLFPTQVEFGALHGNHYADFQLKRPASH